MAHQHQLSPSHPKPDAPRRRSAQRAALWTGVAALAAVAALGIASPKFAGHAHAKPPVVAQVSAPEPIPARETSVPAASEVFAGPRGDAAATPQAPSF